MQKFHKSIAFITAICYYTFSSQAFAALPPMSLAQMYSNASQGNVPALRAAVQRGMNIDTMDRNGNTGLCYSIYRNDKTAYNAFRAAGANARHGCTSNIPSSQYESFMANSNVADVNSSSKAAYGKFNKGEFIISEKVWWTAGALLLIGGGVALAMSGGGGGGSKNSVPPKATTTSLGGVAGTKKPTNAPSSYTGVMIGSSVNTSNGKIVENNNTTVTKDSTGTDVTTAIVDLLDFSGNIKKYAEYIRVGMKTATLRDTVTNIAILDLKDATAGLVAVGDAKIATNNSNGELIINAKNGTIGMIASEKALAQNDGIIQINFSGTDAKHQVIGMYADSMGQILNNKNITATSSQNSSNGTIIGMSTRITDHEDAPMPNNKASALNSTNGKIELTTAKSDGVATAVNLIGMGSFLDKDFLDGTKTIRNAGYTSLENQGNITLQSNTSNGSKYTSNIKNGTAGIIGMLSDAHSTAQNSGTIKINLSGDVTDYTNAQAGMLSTHGGKIDNSGNIDITGGTGGYGMVAIYGAGTSSQFNKFIPNISNSGTIKINSLDGFGIASYHPGFTGTPTEIVNTEDGIIHLASKGTGIYSNTGNIENYGDILLDSGGDGIVIKSDSPAYDVNASQIFNESNIIIKNAFNSSGISAEAGLIVNNGNIQLENLTNTTANSNSYGMKITNGIADNFIVNYGNIEMNIKNADDGTTKTYGMYSDKVDIGNGEEATILLHETGTGIYSIGDSAVGGKVDNEGSIILNKGGTGIETVNAHVNIFPDGKIIITGIGTETGVGIKTVNGVVTNENLIDITANNSIGIDSNNYVENKEGSQINVTGLDGIGINLGTNGTVLNSGDINITGGTVLNGMNHYGIKSTATTSQSIINDGNINLSGKYFPGNANQAYGISVEKGDVKNNGSISFTNFYGIGINSTSGIIENNGFITLDNGGIGIKGGADSQISNLAGGTIQIDPQASADTSYGIKSDGGRNVINQGNIEVSVNDSYGIHMTDGIAMNEDNIVMTGSGSVGMMGLGTNISTNTGTITTTGDDSSGMSVDGTTTSALNYGDIYLNGNGSFGMMGINGANISNGGQIIINSEDSFGMFVSGGSTASNYGTIDLMGPPSGSTGFGMYAEGGSKIYNATTGVIHVQGIMTGMYATGADSEVYNEGTILIDAQPMTQTCTDGAGCDAGNWIVLDDGAVFKTGGLVASTLAMNFSSFSSDETGKTYVAKGGSFKAPELSGTIYADSSIVASGFETEYTNKNSFIGEDKGIILNSGSYMFDSELLKQENGKYDIVMNMKDMNDLVDDESVANFLNDNYSMQKGANLFSLMKSANNQNDFGTTLSNQLGLDFFPSLSRQNLEAIKSLDRSVNQTLFSSENIKEISSKVGYDFYNKNQENSGVVSGYKENANSVYAIAEKRHNENLSYGIGASVSKIDSKYKNGSKRDDALFQLLYPVKYKLDELTFLSTPKLGLGFGEYERHAGGEVYKANTLNYLYGITNEARKDINLNFFTLEPTAEFNVLGIYQNKTKEKNQITVKSSNNVSVEAGLGLYAKKEFTINEDNSINFRTGATYYQELNSSYENSKASMSGMVGDYNMKGYESQRYRGVASARVEYKHKDIKFFTSAGKLIEKDGAYDFKAGVAVEF